MIIHQLLQQLHLSSRYVVWGGKSLFSKNKIYHFFVWHNAELRLDSTTMATVCDESLSQIWFRSEGFAAFTSKLPPGQERKMFKKSKCLWYESELLTALSASHFHSFCRSHFFPFSIIEIWRPWEADSKPLTNDLFKKKTLTSYNMAHISMATLGRPQLIYTSIQYISFHMISKIIWLSICLINVHQRSRYTYLLEELPFPAAHWEGCFLCLVSQSNQYRGSQSVASEEYEGCHYFWHNTVLRLWRNVKQGERLFSVSVHRFHLQSQTLKTRLPVREVLCRLLFRPDSTASTCSFVCGEVKKKKNCAELIILFQ